MEDYNVTQLKPSSVMEVPGGHTLTDQFRYGPSPPLTSRSPALSKILSLLPGLTLVIALALTVWIRTEPPFLLQDYRACGYRGGGASSVRRLPRATHDAGDFLC